MPRLGSLRQRRDYFDAYQFHENILLRENSTPYTGCKGSHPNPIRLLRHVSTTNPPTPLSLPHCPCNIASPEKTPAAQIAPAPPATPDPPPRLPHHPPTAPR